MEAISVKNVHKQFGRGSKKFSVLSDLCMNVPKGCIYGLLGPSGCGKTTLLHCIVGKHKIQSGSIKVFGENPRPGGAIGYMPQEMALYREFSIKETLEYFGRIFGMKKSDIKLRTIFLLDFLDLPKSSKLIGNLSGGQQRRVSLASALLHNPQLLILDEPTVGVDPLLRQCIWSHLLDIRQTTTVVITTHYIEEARQADYVGMMREGRLLTEGKPNELMEAHNKTELEDVFLRLIEMNVVRNEEGEDSGFLSGGSRKNVEENVILLSDEEANTEKSRAKSSSSLLTGHRLNALLIKNFIRMWRNAAFLFFQFIIPTIQVALFCLAIGREPRKLALAVVNDEIDAGSCLNFTDSCILGEKSDFWGDFEYPDDDEAFNENANLSCRFMSYLNDEVIIPQDFDDFPSAVESVKSGKTFGILYFNGNYTDSVSARMQLKEHDDETLESSQIRVYLDETDPQIGYTVKLELGKSFQAFSKGLLEACDLDENLASIPLTFEEPIYGSPEPTFTEFMSPGVILSIIYFMAVGLTALSFVLERKEGLLDRSWVAGVTSTEVMLAHVITQFAVMFVQVVLVLLFMIYVFEIPSEGPIFWTVALALLQGLCGMSLGLVISAVCDTEQDAIQLALGSFYPNLLLSGIIWPLEGMPRGLRYISYILPQTYACQAMRGILSRGWGIVWMQVFRGYLVTIAWILALLVLSALFLRMRR